MVGGLTKALRAHDSFTKRDPGYIEPTLPALRLLSNERSLPILA